MLHFSEKERKSYNKAEKIKYKHYDGKFIVDDCLMNSDELEKWLKDKLISREDVPKYLWATTICKEKQISTRTLICPPIDCKEEQGEAVYSYRNNYKEAVILTDLIEKIKEDIETEIANLFCKFFSKLKQNKTKSI